MKKGFTLVELLGVIIILAVIALIAIPKVNNIISKSRLAVNTRSAEGYLESLNRKLLDNNIDDGSYTVDDLKTINNDFSGKIPDSGNITVLAGTIVNSNLVFGKNTINIDSTGTAIDNAKVYGLKWDGDNSYTRLNDAQGMTSCVGTDEQSCTSDFDSAEIYREIHDVEVNGDYFVYIPKFYIKKVVSGDQWQWFISKQKKDNSYYLPLCFVSTKENNKELPYILVSKYNMSLYRNDLYRSEFLLESKPNTIPYTCVSFETMRNYLVKKNANSSTLYQFMDIHIVDILQVLFYVEFANVNSQSIMEGLSSGIDYSTEYKITSVNGLEFTLDQNVDSLIKVGRVINVNSICSEWGIVTSVNGNKITIKEELYGNSPRTYKVGDTVYFMMSINGLTDSVKAKSGSPGNNTSGDYPMEYRGIENLYGGILQYIDGIAIDAQNSNYYKFLMEDYPQNYTQNINTISDFYFPIFYEFSSMFNGTFDTMRYDSEYPYLFFPISQKYPGHPSPFGDIFVNSTSGPNVRFLMFGGSWNQKEKVGITSYDITARYNSLYPDLGTRLVKRAE